MRIIYIFIKLHEDLFALARVCRFHFSQPIARYICSAFMTQAIARNEIPTTHGVMSTGRNRSISH
ncbi:hypothetical protein DIE19_09340 [Burkholderia sp. Bp9126]|nr:hypothetical protein DIE19_09340 [Burkholderia sp. Bp9126]